MQFSFILEIRIQKAQGQKRNKKWDASMSNSQVFTCSYLTFILFKIIYTCVCAYIYVYIYIYFCLSVVLQCMNIPQFVFRFPVDRHLGFFLLFCFEELAAITCHRSLEIAF